MCLVSLTTPFDQQRRCHRRADESQTAESIERDGVAKWTGADQDIGEYLGIVPRRSARGISPNFLFAQPLPYILRLHAGGSTVNRVGCLFLDRKPHIEQMERLVPTHRRFSRSTERMASQILTRKCDLTSQFLGSSMSSASI
jgi:hypothetical protein